MNGDWPDPGHAAVSEVMAEVRRREREGLPELTAQTIFHWWSDGIPLQADTAPEIRKP